VSLPRSPGPKVAKKRTPTGKRQIGLSRFVLQSQTPPASGWLDEWGRLEGGRLFRLGVAPKRVLVHEIKKGPPVPSATSRSRMHWRICSNSTPTVDRA